MVRVTEITNQSNTLAEYQQLTTVIYKISFPNNPKVYIGKSCEPETRWYIHQRNVKNGRKEHLYHALRLYGIETAIFEVIATCLKEEYANEAEIAMIAQYDSFDNGYNMTPGGEGYSGLNHPLFGKEPWNKGKKCPQYSGKNHPMFGKHQSKEANKKNSLAHIGKSSNQSKIWKLHYKDGRIDTVKKLDHWCKQNGYCSGGIKNVCYGYRKKYKDIIYVEQV